MSNKQTKAIVAAAEHARGNPSTASEDIKTLLKMTRQEEGGGDAAMAIASIARDAPEALTDVADDLSYLLSDIERVHVRRNLAESISLLATQGMRSDAIADGLTEATRIREDSFWEEEPDAELNVIKTGLDGWVQYADQTRPVPKQVVQRATQVADVADLSILLSVIDVMRAAIETESPEQSRAFRVLIHIANSEDQTIRSQATIALAKAVLNGTVDNKNAVREVLKSNVGAVNVERENVKRAIEMVEE